MQKTGSQVKMDAVTILRTIQTTVFSPPNPPSGPLPAGCTGPFATCLSSARTDTPTRVGLQRTSHSPTPPACSSFPITTFSACSTARALPWKTWASAKRNWMPMKRARSGSALPRPTTSFAARPRGMWLDFAFEKLFGLEERLSAQQRQRLLRHHQRQAGLPGFPPSSTLRAIQHRGAGHHQPAAGSADLPSGDPRLRMESPHPAHVSSRFGGRSRIRRLPPECAAAGRDARRRLHLAGKAICSRFATPATASRNSVAPRPTMDTRPPGPPTFRDRSRRTLRPGDRGQGRRRRAGTLPRPDADRNGAHERRGRPGDAAPPRQPPQSQSPSIYQRFGRDVGADIPMRDRLCSRAAAAAGSLRQRRPR